MQLIFRISSPEAVAQDATIMEEPRWSAEILCLVVMKITDNTVKRAYNGA